METIKVMTMTGERVHLLRKYTSRLDTHTLCGLSHPFQLELMPIPTEMICKKCMYSKSNMVVKERK